MSASWTESHVVVAVLGIAVGALGTIVLRSEAAPPAPAPAVAPTTQSVEPAAPVVVAPPPPAVETPCPQVQAEVAPTPAPKVATRSPRRTESPQTNPYARDLPKHDPLHTRR